MVAGALAGRLNAQELTVYVADTATEAPVASAAVRLMRGETVLAEGTTNGSGVVTFDLAVGTEVAGVPAPGLQVSAAYPNPTAGTVHFDATLGSAAGDAPLRVALYDLLGRQVLEADWTLAPGAHRLEADLCGLAAGVYLLRVHHGAFQQGRTLVLHTSQPGQPALRVQSSGVAAPDEPATKQASVAALLTLSVRKDGYAEHRLTRTFAAAEALTLGLDPVLEQDAQDVTDSGGAVALENGVRLVVPPSSVPSGSARIELSALHANSWFEAPHQQTIHVNVASGQVASLALHVPVADAEAAARTTVTRLADPDSVYTEYLAGQYDASVGAFVVPLGTGGKTLQGQVNGVFLIEGAVEVSLTHTSRLLEMPYYEQDGDNCWAAAWLMMLKSYAPQSSRSAIYELLHLQGVGKDDGLSWRDMRGLVAPTQTITGQTVAERRWTNFENFIGYVMERVDDGVPVLANLITHQVLFVGYEIQNPGLNQTVTLIAHDPQQSGAQTAYMRKAPSYFKEKYFDLSWIQFRTFNQFSTIAAEGAAAGGSGLTIHLPDGTNAKGLSFVGKSYDGPTPRTTSEAVTWDHTQPTGLHLDELPDSLETIKLQRVPIWNASGSSQQVTVTSRLSTYREGGDVVLHTASTPLTVGAHAQVLYATNVTWKDLDDRERNDVDFVWQTDLLDGGGQRVGGFRLNFTAKPDAPYIEYLDILERTWTTYIPYPSQTATAQLLVSGGKGVRVETELFGAAYQAILRVPQPPATGEYYSVRLNLSDLTGPIETLEWMITDANGTRTYSATTTTAIHQVLVKQARVVVSAWATTYESSHEQIMVLYIEPE